nr:MAG TPA: hypothetical protein [Caudoviricetes sp.]
MAPIGTTFHRVKWLSVFGEVTNGHYHISFFLKADTLLV